MILPLKNYIIKLLEKNPIEADRKIISLLAHEIFVKSGKSNRKKKLEDYFYPLMEKFKVEKSKGEFELLCEIMRQKFIQGSKNLGTEIKKTEKMIEEYKKNLRKLNDE